MLSSTIGVRIDRAPMRSRGAAQASAARHKREVAEAAASRLQVRDRLRDLVVVDLFCGGGGATEACVKAIAELKNVPLSQVPEILSGIIKAFLAVNHWDDAIATHKQNHPFATHYLSDVGAVSPTAAVKGGRVHLLLAGPECFPAGALVLTLRGLVPIEDVKLGDRVLTHKGRWQRVYSVMESTKDTVVVQGHGHYGLETTASHPFLALSRQRIWNNGIRRWEHHWTEPTWVPASEMQDCYWAAPTKSFQDSLTIPRVGGRGVAFSPDFWWMVGRWLGDGSLRTDTPHQKEVQICCSYKEAGELQNRLSLSLPAGREAVCGKYRWRRHAMRTAVVFEMRHTGLADWLIQHFGQLAHGKTIPAWVLTMPPDWQRALLDGYLSADGHWVADRGKHMATTVSKRLAIGIKLLAEGLGYRVALHKYPQHSNKIEGRIFGGRDLYELAWLEDRQRQYNHEAGGHSYGRVRSIKTGHQAVTVYNLSVEEDESFVADGIVVHNCTFHSNAAGDRPVNDQSRMSAFAVLDWLEKLYVDSFIIENVPEFRMWGPLNADGGRNKRRKGEIFRKYISMIEALGYEVQYRVLKAADYGDPTSRERLFILGRRDGRPVVWPEPTHAHPKQLAAMQRQSSLFRGATLKPYRTAAEIIDWTDRGTSIFNRDRPLSPNTMRRIWIGLKKYGLKDVLAGNALIAEPFLVKLRNHGGALSVAEPVDTLCASGNHFGVVQLGSFLVGAGGPTGTARPHSVAEPVKTVLGENRIGVVQSFMMGVGGPAGQRRPRDIDEPTPTLTGTNSFAVVHPFILGQQSGGAPRPTSEPAPTIATDGAISLVQSFVMNVRGGDDGYFRGGSVDEPLGAVTTHPAMSLVQVDPFMMAIDQTGSRSGQVRGVDGVVGTLTAKNRMAVASAEAGLQPYPDGWRPDLASGESCWQPFLIRYNGTGIGADLGEPLGALTTKERYALCLPVTRGYLLVDVYFRMFKPVEMARAHSYPASFAFVNAAGKPASNQDATKMIGNSWPIDMGAALVVVQLAPRARMSAASATARMLMRGPALVA